MNQSLALAFVFLCAVLLSTPALDAKENNHGVSEILIVHDGGFDKRDSAQLVSFLRRTAYIRYRVLSSDQYDSIKKAGNGDALFTFVFKRGKTHDPKQPTVNLDKRVISVTYPGKSEKGQGERIMKICERGTTLGWSQFYNIPKYDNPLCANIDLKEYPESAHVRDLCPPCFRKLISGLKKDGLTIATSKLEIEYK